MELTLLSKGQIFGGNNEEQLYVLGDYRYGTNAAVTDLCILTGCNLNESIKDNVEEDSSLKGRTGWWWTKSSYLGSAVSVEENNWFYHSNNSRNGIIRPVLQIEHDLFFLITINKYWGPRGTDEVQYGEYPQYAAERQMQKILENEMKNLTLKKTGKNYTFDSTGICDYEIGFNPVSYDEYEYQEKKYIRIKANSNFRNKKFKLSNGVQYKDGDYVWIEVSPVKWLIDGDTELLVSKVGLLSGIRFLDKINNYNSDADFNKTEIKKYFDKYLIRDLFKNINYKSEVNMTLDENNLKKEDKKLTVKKENPYNFKIENVSEEDIIRGAIESGIAVFLHGPSSEGKSSRVKQIDPTCEIIYLRNATPESLNGKSVYNQETGEMIDIKPSWLKKLEDKCKNESDRFHIVFLDEITNALPSIQGIAFNIVLDKEVNGIWKLPENARIVAAGNDMKDSLAANQLAEPLFNRFAHVYIKTTTESWLKWASENNIHPAIYSYIAYTEGKALRSKYDGEKPNADPRKWEMASKMLYATGNPEMLRALVGEDITKEFVSFCNQPVITLNDVINDNFTEEEIYALSVAERYATVLGLSQVNDEYLEKVRRFVKKLGNEFIKVFDSMWIHGDEDKLERLAEARLTEVPEGGIKK